MVTSLCRTFNFCEGYRAMMLSSSLSSDSLPAQQFFHEWGRRHQEVEESEIENTQPFYPPFLFMTSFLIA